MPIRRFHPAAVSRAAALLLALALPVDSSWADEGDLDSTFGHDGQVLWQAGGPFYESTTFEALAVGDAVIATLGTRQGGGGHFAWRALDLDGQGLPGLVCEGPSSLYFSGAVAS